MTVSTLNSIAEFDTNGVTTNFPFYFKFLANEDLVVTYVNPAGVSAILTFGSQYTVNGAGDEDGGSVVTSSALAGPGQLIVFRDMEAFQLTSLRNQGKFLAETHEDVFDKLTMLIQQGFGLLGRALLRPFGKGYFDAQGRNISNLNDPVEDQDAVTKKGMEVYVGSVIDSGSGPENLASNVIYIDPYGIPGVVQDMSGDAGGAEIGYKAPGVNTVKRDIYKKVQKEVELDDYVTGGADHTVQFQNMLADIPNKTTSRLITFAGMSSSYAGTAPRVIVRRGDYSISQTLNPPAYFNFEGEESIITQTNANLDIFSGLAYQWQMEGFVLVGGRHQIDWYNDNINSTMVHFGHIQSFLSSGRAYNSRATGTDGSGNAWTHLSCDATIFKARIMACRQAINNCCDSMTVDSPWIQQNKINMAPSTAAIINKGVSASDPHPLTRLHLKGGVYIPDIGVEGVDRVNSVRWIDNYGSVETSRVRFGGENGGMPIVWQQGGPNTLFPWTNTEVVLKDSTLFCGPESRSDSGVLGIQGNMPNRFVVHNCPGPVSRPLIANLSSTNIPAYMTAFETASGRKAYEYFKLDLDDFIHDLNAYTPLRPLIPDDLYPYLVKGRNTRVRKQNQSITNGFAAWPANPVSFTTVEFDNLGAFAAANPTRLVMPNGCSKMVISVSVIMAVDAAAKTISVGIYDSGGGVVAGDCGQRGINPDVERFVFSYPVYGPPGSYWTVNIRHNAAAALNMIDCRVALSPSDHVV